MTFIDDSALQVVASNMDSENEQKMLDEYFSTASELTGEDITFTVINRGYKHFAFMNVFCSRIDFVFRNEKQELIENSNFEEG